MIKCDVLIVGHAINQSSGGFSDKKYTFLETSDAKYLYNNCFLDTYCAEPMAFMQLAAQIEKAGYSVEVLDGLILGLDIKELVRRIDEYDTKIFAISLYDSTKEDIFAIARYLKRTRKDITIISGGPYATISAEEILSECIDIDYIVVGDADEALPQLVDSVINDKNIAEVSNLFYRENVQIKNTPALCVDINNICRPKRLYSDIIRRRGYSFAVSASRGCGYASCGFCYLRKYQKVGNQPKFRYKQATNLFQEIVDLKNELGVDRLSFTDEDFFGNSDGVKRAMEFFDLLIESNIRISLHVNARARTVLYLARNGLLEKCKRAGVDYMYVGLESYNDRALQNYDKGITVSDIDEVVAALDKYDIRINPGLITFDPSLTIEEVKRNIELYKKIRYYDLFIFTRRLVFYPDASDKVMSMQNDCYFRNPQTQQLFSAMERYRDLVFPWCLKLNRKASTDELCNSIINNHFEFFEVMYNDIIRNENNNSLIDFYAEKTISFIKKALTNNDEQ